MHHDEKFSGLSFDPEDHIVGSIAHELVGTGVRRIATTPDGTTLWGEIFAGRPVDYRAFDADGRELATLVIRPVTPEASGPRDCIELRPDDMTPPEPVVDPDGNPGGDPTIDPTDHTGGCAYICTASDPPRCWRECP